MSVVQEVLQDLPADESVEALAVIPNPELEPIEVSDGGFIPEMVVCYFYGVDEEGNLIETPVEGEKDPQEEIFVGGEYKIQPYWRTLTGVGENADVVELDADGNPIFYPVDPIIDENGWPIWWCVALEPTLDENGNPIETPIEGEKDLQEEIDLINDEILFMPEISVCYFYGVDEEGNLIETPVEGEKDPQEEIFVGGEYKIQPFWRTLTGDGGDGKTISGCIETVYGYIDVYKNTQVEVDENGWPIWWCVLPEILVDENGNPIDPVILYKGEMMEAGSIDDTLLPIEGEGKGDNPYVDENGNPIQTLGGVDPIIDPVVVVHFEDWIAIEVDENGNPIQTLGGVDPVEVDENGNPIQTLGGVDPVVDPIVVVDYIDSIAIEVDENGNPIFPREWLRDVTVTPIIYDLLPIEGDGKGDNPYVDENGNPIQTLGGGDPVIDPVVVVGPCDPIVIECRPYVDEDGNQIYTFGGVEADPVLRNLQVWLADESAEEKAEVKITRQKDISFTMKSSGDEVQELSWDDLINQRVAFNSESAKSSFTMESGDHRYVHGKTGSDKIKGGKGDDWLDGNGGKDSFSAGKGDDHILVDDGKVRSIDGGQGDDTLVLRSDLGAMDLSKVKTLKGIETIDLLSGSGNGLTLTLSAKQLFKNHVDTVKILGDSFDSLVIQGEKVQLQTLVADPEGFSTWHVTWKGHETTLLIDSDINVV